MYIEKAKMKKNKKNKKREKRRKINKREKWNAVRLNHKKINKREGEMKENLRVFITKRGRKEGERSIEGGNGNIVESKSP